MTRPVELKGTVDALVYADDLFYDQVVLGKDPFEIKLDPKDTLSDPFLAPHQDPYVFADGILAPKSMKTPVGWEPMGDIEYRALYYALSKFNQINRSGIEFQKWGEGPDERIFSFADTTPYNFLTCHIFVTLMSTCIPI